MKSKDLSLVIPLYNEEEVVRSVVQDLLKEVSLQNIDLSLILVNNGSRDDTSSILHDLKREFREIEVLDFPENLGYGGGIIEGLKACRKDVLGYMWGDGQIKGDALINVYTRLVEEGLDLCKIFRIFRMDGWKRRVISRIYNYGMPVLFDVDSRDINGCPKLFTRDTFIKLNPTSRDWFIDAEIMVKAKGLGLNYQEIPAQLYERSGGESKVGTRTLMEFMENIVRNKIGWSR